MNSASVMSQCECNVVEEVESTTSTQYVMSESIPTISKVKGGSQVRERAVFEAVMFSELTAERRPGVNTKSVNPQCTQFGFISDRHTDSIHSIKGDTLTLRLHGQHKPHLLWCSNIYNYVCTSWVPTSKRNFEVRHARYFNAANEF